MKKIKFSNWYWKFNNVLELSRDKHFAKLLQVLKIHYSDLSNYMIGYDAYENKS